MPDRNAALIEDYLKSLRLDRAAVENLRQARPGQYATRPIFDALIGVGFSHGRARTCVHLITEAAGAIRAAETAMTADLNRIEKVFKDALDEAAAS